MSSAFTAGRVYGIGLPAHGLRREPLVGAARRVVAAWRQAMTKSRPGVDALVARALAATLAIALGLGLPELMARGFLDRSDGAQAALMSRVLTGSPAF